MAARRRSRAKPEGRVELAPEGLRIGDELVPLHAAAVHYWRLETAAWRPALDAAKSLGFRLVDLYVPWGVHEIGPGEFDFGRKDARLDVARFVTLAKELGLWAIVRPGPHINAELTFFGLPERVVWNDDMQARSPNGKRVILPVPPLAFPVPSYASDAFHSEVARWFAAVGVELAPLMYPKGSIVLLQVDNEGALYFRDGVYDQDWHPDAIKKYRRFLQTKYETVAALRQAHGDEETTFVRVDPPKSFGAKTADELAPHLDWAEFQEQMLADSFTLMRQHLDEAGLTGVPTSHNLPLSESATPLDPERLRSAVGMLGLDYYHGASLPHRAEIARRTTELAERSRASGYAPFACELGAGFPPFFPPLTERDSAFTVLTALAYGLRGFNAYMAVERDRWIGSPIDSSGTIRASAEPWKKLLTGLDRTHFAELQRDASVHILIPRSYRRLTRVLHSFGPLSAAFFQVLGGGAEEACFEDDLGLGAPVAIETERFVRRCEQELDRLRIPYAIVSGDLFEHSMATARWVIVASSGALESDLLEKIERRFESKGPPLTIGPFWPERDASFRPLARKLKRPSRAKTAPPVSLELPLANAIERVAENLDLPRLELEPPDLWATLHVDKKRKPRVLFVVNPGQWAKECTVSAHGARAATDVLDGERWSAKRDRFEVTVSGRSVRMLELG